MNKFVPPCNTAGLVYALISVGGGYLSGHACQSKRSAKLKLSLLPKSQLRRAPHRGRRGTVRKFFITIKLVKWPIMVEMMGYKWEFHCIRQKEPPAHGQPDRESNSWPLEPKPSVLTIALSRKRELLEFVTTIAEFVPPTVDTQN